MGVWGLSVFTLIMHVQTCTCKLHACVKLFEERWLYVTICVLCVYVCIGICQGSLRFSFYFVVIFLYT